MLGGSGQNLNLEVILEVKKAKYVKLQKKPDKSFLAIFDKTVCHKELTFGSG